MSCGREAAEIEYESEKAKSVIEAFRKIAEDTEAIREFTAMIDRVRNELFVLTACDIPMSRNPAACLEKAYHTINELKKWTKV